MRQDDDRRHAEHVKDDGRYVGHDEADVRAHGARNEKNAVEIVSLTACLNLTLNASGEEVRHETQRLGIWSCGGSCCRSGLYNLCILRRHSSGGHDGIHWLSFTYQPHWLVASNKLAELYRGRFGSRSMDGFVGCRRS